MSDDFDLSAHSNDAYFKAVFSEPKQAVAFFRNHLPKDIAASVDWASLAVLPTSFVRRTLQQTHSDLLFSVNMGEGELLLYLLFEHQTTVDPAMPLRLLGYMLDIFLAHERQHGLPLPAILPFVLHQGPETWTAPEQFEDLLNLPAGPREALLPFMPKFRHALLDLTRFDPAREEHHAQMRVVLQLMKFAREKRMVEFMTWLAEEFAGQVPDTLLRLSLTYALHADSTLDLEQIIDIFEGNEPLKEQAMSVAEKLITKGEARGEARGKTLGEAHGIWIGQIQLLQKMLGLPTSARDELSGLSGDELQARLAELQRQYDSRVGK